MKTEQKLKIESIPDEYKFRSSYILSGIDNVRQFNSVMERLSFNEDFVMMNIKMDELENYTKLYGMVFNSGIVIDNYNLSDKSALVRVYNQNLRERRGSIIKLERLLDEN